MSEPKTMYEDLLQQHNILFKRFKQLKAENRELKEKLEILEQEQEAIAEARMEICNNCGDRTDYNIPCKMIRDLDYGIQIQIQENEILKKKIYEMTCDGNCYMHKLNDHLQQKLEKIKEIIEQNSSCIRCKDYDLCAGCEDECYKQILQIIEE